MAEDVKLDSSVYWEGAKELINAWSSYQGVKKLLINATHSETRHKVQRVVDRYYDGSVRRVRETEQERSIEVNMKLREFAQLCECYGVDAVDREWLYRKLRAGKDYNGYRRKIERRLASGKPAQSLMSI